MDINTLHHFLWDRVLRLDVALILLGVLVLRYAASIGYRLFIYPYFVSPLRKLPGPKDHHFLLGHVINQFRGGNPNEPFVSWMQKWPREPLIRYFNIGNSDAVLANSLDAHKEVLSVKQHAFQKPEFFRRMVEDIIGWGVGLVEGEAHRKQRRALAALFSTKNLEAFIPQLYKKADRVSDILEGIIEHEGGVVDVATLYSKIMLEIICLFSTGRDLDEMTGTSPNAVPFEQLYHELFEPDDMGKLLIAINAAIPIRWIPLKANRRYNSSFKALRNQVNAVIRERIRELDPKSKVDRTETGNLRRNKGFTDLLTWMVETKYYGVGGGGDGKGGDDSDDDDRWGEDLICDQILTFLAAGHQTSADVLTWATQLMIQHPNEEQKLRDEITNLLNNKNNKTSPQPTYREIESLPYLNNFTREVLRAQCPAINYSRVAIQDVVIQGTLLPKGTTVLMQPAIIQRNPTIWGEDCDSFRPDRWDEIDEHSEAADSWAFTAFGQGPRNCIGRTFSLLETKIFLIELVRRFRFGLPEGEEGRVAEGIRLINPSTMLKPADGLRFKVERAV